MEHYVELLGTARRIILFLFIYSLIVTGLLVCTVYKLIEVQKVASVPTVVLPSNLEPVPFEELDFE